MTVFSATNAERTWNAPERRNSSGISTPSGTSPVTSTVTSAVTSIAGAVTADPRPGSRALHYDVLPTCLRRPAMSRMPST